MLLLCEIPIEEAKRNFIFLSSISCRKLLDDLNSQSSHLKHVLDTMQKEQSVDIYVVLRATCLDKPLCTYTSPF